MVPRLLKHLSIPYVSPASHSGGSIYLLNTLLAYPHLLHPHQPYVCLFAPWVRPVHSKITLWQVTSQLPAPLIGKFASLAKAVNNNIVPLIGMSGSFVSTNSRPIHPATTARASSASAEVPRSPASSVGLQDSHGLALGNPEIVKELRKHITSLLFAENLDGVSADAQLFLNRPRAVPWCSPSMLWSDVDHFVPLLSKILEEDDRLALHNRVLNIDTFHAESDHMVGEKGRQWFDECWLPGRSSTSSARSNSFEAVKQFTHRSYYYQSEAVKGADHDLLMDPAFGASEKWLQRVRDAVPRHVEV
ncbi:hypothetical protein HBH56_044020 [Parastagonospora nodorum]|uniref:Uncharacterized protein n=1 Tax=Phaeosphaeria nodorum (strain SN15 / ATCC MYA-4574 / FGSC 10173) TaxID=321614 RepID=A0A7U2ETP7_PHANO|nr:hypothetical protein HBH56_044020 [Parastagonospora nodorum]QRC92799.1 hypothetical protein JI435_081430 [Parastagonospora nodorum SN15]KAH3933132.1 hypothetical protein HBH54_071770 [Parastagonospora nodorum]KAH4139663.1 hypothetical protein HBH45_091890 [Parastagonospora nodorum]KAH4168805.1 hypothetical protein HBH44_044710 [Parastagonospora nodorum]